MKKEKPTLTAGGTIPPWILPKRTRLLFRTATSEVHVEDLSQIRIINYEGFPAAERRKLESVPSILGRDIILKFKTTLTHKKLEMER